VEKVPHKVYKQWQEAFIKSYFNLSKFEKW